MSEVVKEGLHRLVVKEGEHALKVYRHARVWGRPFDRARAAAELRWLRELSDRGLAVPRPLGLERGTLGWQIRMQWIEAAIPLGKLLEKGELVGERGVDFFERLGQSLASLHELGIQHPDPHVDNVVIDGDDRPWLLDWKGARRRRRPDPVSERAELIAWLASFREALAPAVRRALIDAWSERRRGAAAPHEEWLELESEARSRRRALIAHGAGRWLRPSSQVTVEGSRGRRTVTRRVTGGPALHHESRFCLRGTAAACERRWLNAVRLIEHGLPAALPDSLEEGPNETTLGCHWPGCGPPTESPARARGRLLGGLHERGLNLARFGHESVCDTPRGPRLLPPLELFEFDPLGADAATRFSTVEPAWLEPGFRSGYVDAFGEHEREAVARRSVVVL